eukprot:14694-Pyramimonas_sp.AAC.1
MQAPALAAQHRPHFLQECLLTNSQRHTLRRDLQPFECTLLEGADGGGALARDGCDVAPIAALPEDEEFWAQRLAP